MDTCGGSQLAIATEVRLWRGCYAKERHVEAEIDAGAGEERRVWTGGLYVTMSFDLRAFEGM